MSGIKTWVVAETGHFYGRFASKRAAIHTLQALRLDGRKCSKVRRMRDALYEYTPPSTSSRQSKVYVGSERELRRLGFGDMLDDPDLRPDKPVGDEECEHCSGTGRQSEDCSSCGKSLTSDNVARAIGYDADYVDQCIECYVGDHPDAEAES